MDRRCMQVCMRTRKKSIRRTYVNRTLKKEVHYAPSFFVDLELTARAYTLFISILQLFLNPKLLLFLITRTFPVLNPYKKPMNALVLTGTEAYIISTL